MPKTYRRNHNLNRIKTRNTYTVEEISDLMGVDKKTVYAWVKKGLITIDTYPQLIHGSDLKDFLRKERSGRKHPCKADEMYCCKCRCVRKPSDGKIEVEQRTSKIINLKGKCEVCGTRIYKGISAKELEKYQKMVVRLKPEQMTLVGF